MYILWCLNIHAILTKRTKMRTFILLLVLTAPCMGFAQNEESPTDYGALTNSLMYLNQKWVDEPAQRAHQLHLQQVSRPAPQAYGYQAAPHPTCYQVPYFSVIDGQPMGTRTVCQ